jgi:hypothetical protein
MLSNKKNINVTQVKAVPQFGRLVTGLSPWRPGFTPGSVHVGFVVDKEESRQVLLQVLLFPRQVAFHCEYIFIYHVRNEQEACWWPQFRDISLTPLTRRTTRTTTTTLSSKMKVTVYGVEIYDSQYKNNFPFLMTSIIRKWATVIFSKQDTEQTHVLIT